MSQCQQERSPSPSFTTHKRQPRTNSFKGIPLPLIYIHFSLSIPFSEEELSMAHPAEFKLQGLGFFRGSSTAQPQPEALDRCLHHEGRNAAGANTPNSNIHDAYPTFLANAAEARLHPSALAGAPTVEPSPRSHSTAAAAIVAAARVKADTRSA